MKPYAKAIVSLLLISLMVGIVTFVLVMIEWFETTPTDTVEVNKEALLEGIQERLADIDHTHDFGDEIPEATRLDSLLHPVALGSRETRWLPMVLEFPVADSLDKIVRPLAAGTNEVKWEEVNIPDATDLTHILRPASVGTNDVVWANHEIPLVTDLETVLRPSTPNATDVVWKKEGRVLKTMYNVTLTAGTPTLAAANCYVPAGLLTNGYIEFRVVLTEVDDGETVTIALEQGAPPVTLQTIAGTTDARWVVCEGTLFEPSAGQSSLHMRRTHTDSFATALMPRVENFVFDPGAAMGAVDFTLAFSINIILQAGTSIGIKRGFFLYQPFI